MIASDEAAEMRLATSALASRFHQSSDLSSDTGSRRTEVPVL